MTDWAKLLAAMPSEAATQSMRRAALEGYSKEVKTEGGILMMSAGVCERGYQCELAGAMVYSRYPVGAGLSMFCKLADRPGQWMP